jgi:hypothetical protein
MKSIPRVASVVVGTLALALAGATSAYAFSYPTLTVSSDGLERGQGYGQVDFLTFNDGRLQPWLRDSRVDNMRAYTQLYASKGPGDAFAVESDRRADGGTTFADMANKSFSRSSSISAYSYTIYVCADKNLATDPCSAAYNY